MAQAMTAKQAKAVAERYAKAVELVQQGRVHPLYGRDGFYVVVNGQGLAYLVNLVNGGECDCPDSQYRASKIGVCKHALAAMLYEEQQQAEAGGGHPHQPEPEPEGDDDVEFARKLFYQHLQ